VVGRSRRRYILEIVTAELQIANLVYLKNPIIRIFCVFGWLGVQINPDKWSFTAVAKSDSKDAPVVMHIPMVDLL
jgi:hypothetical protein